MQRVIKGSKCYPEDAKGDEVNATLKMQRVIKGSKCYPEDAKGDKGK